MPVIPPRENAVYILVRYQPRDMDESLLCGIGEDVWILKEEAEYEARQLNEKRDGSTWDAYWEVKKMKMNFGNL